MRVFFNMDSDCVFIDSQTKIVWRDNLEQKGKEYVYGLRFIEMSDGDMKKLKIFLKSYSGARQERKWPGLLGWVKEGGLAKKR